MVMLAADTNVWARAYLNDDTAQVAKARSALAQAGSRGGVFVPLIVLAELSWVLRGRWERERILNTIESLPQTRGVVVESPTLAWKAMGWGSIGGQSGRITSAKKSHDAVRCLCEAQFLSHMCSGCSCAPRERFFRSQAINCDGCLVNRILILSDRQR